MSAPVSFQIVLGLAMFVLVFVPLERLFPVWKQRAFRRGWLTDLTYYVAGCFVGKFSDATSLAAALLIRRAIGFDSGGLIAAQPAWIQFLEVLLIADFIAYWYHRFIHRNHLMWRLHKVHHTSLHMDWLANVRLHPMDKILGDCAQFIPIFLLGFADAPILAYTIFLGFQGFLNHSNIKVNYGPLRWLIASPQFHHWHHYNNPEFYDKNFSPHLVIFDRLFGTFYLPRDGSRPAAYGIPEPVPESFAGQMLFPFTRSAVVSLPATGDEHVADGPVRGASARS